MTPVQICGNRVERIVAGKFRRVEMQPGDLPCHAKGVENSPPCGKSDKGIIELRNTDLAESPSLNRPQDSKVAGCDSGNQRVTKSWLPLAARIVANQQQRQKDNRRFFR